MAKIYALPDKSIEVYQGLIKVYKDEEQFFKAASVWCDLEGLDIPSKYFVGLMHYQHHRAHRIERKLTDTGTKPNLPDIKAIQANAGGLISLINEAYERMYEVCEKLNQAVKDADGDTKTVNHLCKYVARQEDIVNDFAKMIKLSKGVDETNRAMLLILIKKLFK